MNEKGGFGLWEWDVAFEPAKMQDVIHKHAGSATVGSTQTPTSVPA